MNHIPVLHSSVLSILTPKAGETVIDVTLGLAGHAQSFLTAIGRRGRLIGIDADDTNLGEARKVLKGRSVQIIHANFRDIASLDLPQCDILFADLGLSSPHIDDPQRGFSFRGNGPLDLRFDRSYGCPASHILAFSSPAKLEHIFHEYGEIRMGKKLVAAIVKMRESEPFETTDVLVRVSEKVFGWKSMKLLPQIFQALRIAVNDEIGSLAALLHFSPSLLKPGGRMGVISYHSLEDRLVKQRFRDLTKPPATFELLTKKAVKVNLNEIENNPRSRSARFRAIRKLHNNSLC